MAPLETLESSEVGYHKDGGNTPILDSTCGGAMVSIASSEKDPLRKSPTRVLPSSSVPPSGRPGRLRPPPASRRVVRLAALLLLASRRAPAPRGSSRAGRRGRGRAAAPGEGAAAPPTTQAVRGRRGSGGAGLGEAERQ